MSQMVTYSISIDSKDMLRYKVIATADNLRSARAKAIEYLSSKRGLGYCRIMKGNELVGKVNTVESSIPSNPNVPKGIYRRYQWCPISEEHYWDLDLAGNLVVKFGWDSKDEKYKHVGKKPSMGKLLMIFRKTHFKKR